MKWPINNPMWFAPGLILVLILLPLVIKDPYLMHIIIMGAVHAVLCMGWVFILRVGQFSLGHAAFYAIGSYGCALSVIKTGVSFWVALVFGSLLSAAAAYILGRIILRIKGLYFSIITFAFAEIIRLVITNWSFLGGVTGISNIPKPSVFGFVFTAKVHHYYLILIINIVAALIFRRIDQSRIGMNLRSISSNETLSQSIGINSLNHKIMVFVIAGFFAGTAGGFYGHYYNFISPMSFTVWESINIQVFSTIGGVISPVAGPAIGGILMTFVGEFLRSAKEIEPILYGTLLIVTVYFLPGGLISLPSVFSNRSKPSAGSS